MSKAVFAANLRSLATRNRILADTLAAANSDGAYTGLQISKTGLPVPVSAGGVVFNSLYDPMREASLLIDTVPQRCFVFFAGIGGAFHIRDFLRRHPESSCAVAESGESSLRSLLEILDVSDILSNPRVTLIPDCTAATGGDVLSAVYLPALHGAFRFLPLRSWRELNREKADCLEEQIQRSLSLISADFSVQAHFGKQWMRNCIRNLQYAESFQGRLPTLNADKTAVIVAAGPSLEMELEDLEVKRDEYVIITTDTAYGTLVESGISADIFVSIDCQAVSVNHVMHALTPGMTVILDVCGNAGIAHRAVECASNLIFASGGHPLARYASAYSGLPVLDTSSGTVTVAAIDAAHSLGFKNIRVIGADFAYTNGKPYSRGTYLASGFGQSSHRLLPAESLYTTLMFRTPVSRFESGTGVTYRTDVLDGYATAYRRHRADRCWNPAQLRPFPARDFLIKYRKDLEKVMTEIRPDDSVLHTLLPFFAWNTRFTAGLQCQKTMQEAIQLALDLIAGYTESS